MECATNHARVDFEDALMCLAVPMRIKVMEGFRATCEAKGIEREVSLGHSPDR
jgi:hypothetical protein